MSSLQGKGAIITGAGSGFGAGIARAFADAGAVVCVADINLAAAQSTADAIGGAAFAVHVDITSANSVRSFTVQALERFGRQHRSLDILVNNAGLGLSPRPLEDVAEADFDRVLAVNTKGIFNLAVSCIPHMKRIGRGVVLNIASTAGVSPRPGLTWYNASKGWVITATRSMAVELAPFGIRVNAINPVAGETPMLSTFMGGDTDELRRKFISTIPLGRLSTPEDIAGAAVFLCSDAASLITGIALEVDGGRCI